MFDAGGVFVSPDVLSFLSWEEIDELVAKHVSGDFGTVSRDIVAQNERLIKKPTKRGRIRSIYSINGWKVLVSSIPGEYTNIAFEVERYRWPNI